MKNREYLILENKELWIEKGHYFGYPECCIENFCTRGFELTDEQEMVHKNSGFIPCPECSKKIINGQKTLKSLIKNRVCPNEFKIP